MVCVLAGALALATALVAAKDVSAAPSPALASGATQISGLGFYPDDEHPCDDREGGGANYALILEGDLKGCLYTFIETAKSSPSGTYRETGREVFVAADGSGTFRTTYRVEAKYEDVATLTGEIFGRCQHPIVKGSGTGIYEGVTGILLFKDDVETVTFPYRGHLRY
jgi:hypothetical protein